MVAGTIPYRKSPDGCTKRDKMFKSKDELDHQVRILAAKLARRLSMNGVSIDKDKMYEALRSELTVGDVLELMS